MLDPWIIEEILKREDGAGRDERPMLEIPLDRPRSTEPVIQEEEKAERGVEIVDFGI